MDPFKEFTHGGTLKVAEILFHTSFDYMFPILAADPASTLAPGATTQGALLSLGTAMATDSGTTVEDSTIPSVFTYFGQFIDHNITAQTDREIGVSRIATPDGMVMDLTPLPSKEVVKKLINGRRPKLDLSQLYGDGPRIGQNATETEADILFDSETLAFKVVSSAPGYDVPRQDDGTAIIADMRNNENLNISQLHVSFLVFHNKVLAGLPSAPKELQFIRARQLVRWAYQYVVMHDYLPNVCDATIVQDVLANGARYYAPDNDLLFLPLEFSVAAFRFGHSMIRPSYQINTGPSLPLANVLGFKQYVTGGPPPALQGAEIIAWHNFADFNGEPPPQKARQIDPFIADALGNMPNFMMPGSTTQGAGPLLQNLARRNLLRGFLLSLPTGQAVADAMQMKPLTPEELRGKPGTATYNAAIYNAVVAGDFDTATPLWYYILREAQIQQGGNRLGSVGSRIVAETLEAMISRDKASYMNNHNDPAVTTNGIKIGGTVIATIADILKFAGVPI